MKHEKVTGHKLKSPNGIKHSNVKVYDATALPLAEKFDDIGARVEEIDLAFSYIKDKDKDNPHIVEIGCGNGREARELLKRTNNYIGVDFSEGMLEVARKQLPGANFILADLESYKFPAETDAVFAFASLLHSNKSTIATVLDRAWHALSDEGIFLITLKKGEYAQRVKVDEFGTRYYYFYMPEDINSLAGEKYSVAELLEEKSRGRDWITIVLKKKLN